MKIAITKFSLIPFIVLLKVLTNYVKKQMPEVEEVALACHCTQGFDINPM